MLINQLFTSASYLHQFCLVFVFFSFGANCVDRFFFSATPRMRILAFVSSSCQVNYVLKQAGTRHNFPRFTVLRGRCALSYPRDVTFSCHAARTILQILRFQ